MYSRRDEKEDGGGERTAGGKEEEVGREGHGGRATNL